MTRYILALILVLITFIPAQAARLFTCGWEENNATTTMWQIGSGTIETATPHSGTYYGQVLGNAGSFRRDLPANLTSGTLYTRAYFQMSNVASGTEQVLQWQSDAGARGFEARKIAGGTIRLVDSAAATIAETTATISADTWYRVEIEHVIGDSGSVRLKLFLGESTTAMDDISASSVDVMNTNVRRVLFQGSSGSGAAIIRVDDVAINDTSGAIQTSWPGPGKIYLLVPNTEVSITFTPSTGTDNSANVDDVPGTPDDDTTYNSSATANDEDRLGMTDLGAEVPSDATITLLDVYGRIRGEGTTSTRQMRVLLWDEAGAQTNGPTTALNDSTAYAIMSTTDHLVLSGSGKTKTNVASFDVGYEPLTAHATRVSAMWVNVEWTEAVAGGEETFGLRKRLLQ